APVNAKGTEGSAAAVSDVRIARRPVVERKKPAGKARRRRGDGATGRKRRARGRRGDGVTGRKVVYSSRLRRASLDLLARPVAPSLCFAQYSYRRFRNRSPGK